MPEPNEIAEFHDIDSFRDHHTFLGALDKKKLSLPERLAVRAVKAPEGDFRDWEDIHGWALAIANELSSGGSQLGHGAAGEPSPRAEQREDTPPSLRAA